MGLLGWIQICIVYEPFELKFRPSITLEQLEGHNYSDTILDIRSISKIVEIYKSILNTRIKREKGDLHFPKIMCDLYSNGKRVDRFYYNNQRVIIAKGHEYNSDLGLLNVILASITSDEKFSNKLRELKP